MPRYPAQPLEEKLAWMREKQTTKAQLEEPALLTIAEAAKELRVSLPTARRILRREPGVIQLLTPGSHVPILRVPRAVMDRILRGNVHPI